MCDCVLFPLTELKVGKSYTSFVIWMNYFTVILKLNRVPYDKKISYVICFDLF